MEAETNARQQRQGATIEASVELLICILARFPLCCVTFFSCPSSHFKSRAYFTQYCNLEHSAQMNKGSSDQTEEGRKSRRRKAKQQMQHTKQLSSKTSNLKPEQAAQNSCSEEVLAAHSCRKVCQPKLSGVEVGTRTPDQKAICGRGL